MRRGLFLADGVSDLPLSTHIEALCRQAGTDITLTAFPAERLRTRAVHGRIQAILAEDPYFDVIFVHRDSEDPDPEPRHREIAAAKERTGFEGPVVPVVTVRMMEAWLLLDEDAIRRIAGKPGGRRALGLPSLRQAERLADPKAELRRALADASELTGRKLTMFKRQFGIHRARLIEDLDLDGRPRDLQAVQRLCVEVATAMDLLN